MIRQPVSVGGSGGGADYTSFLVAGDSTCGEGSYVYVQYISTSGALTSSMFFVGSGDVCEKNSASTGYVYYLEESAPPDPPIVTDGRAVVKVENGILVITLAKS